MPINFDVVMDTKGRNYSGVFDYYKMTELKALKPSNHEETLIALSLVVVFMFKLNTFVLLYWLMFVFELLISWDKQI